MQPSIQPTLSTATSPFNFLRFGGLAPPWTSRGSYVFTASLPTLLGDHSGLLYAQCITGYVQRPLYLGMVARVRVERTYSRLMRPDETVSSRCSGRRSRNHIVLYIPVQAGETVILGARRAFPLYHNFRWTRRHCNRVQLSLGHFVTEHSRYHSRV